MKTRDKIIYAAGFLDGEGCFFIRRGRAGQYIYGVQANQVRTAPLELLQELFGGRIYEKAGTKNHKQFWDWRITAAEPIVSCVDTVVPWLLVKRDQAEILKEFCSLILTTQQERRRGLSEGQHAERERLMQAVRDCRL